MTAPQWRNQLYFGDNLPILREHIADESVDLIYLDPPFNSNANYNVLFRETGGQQSAAQITAFEDTWHWSLDSEAAYQEIVTAASGKLPDFLQGMRSFLGENDMMAYLTMMAQRLVELHRVLKPTGSIYLHCDPTAGHYLRMLMDSVFGSQNFCNDIIWHYRKWSTGKFTFQRNHDVILFYARSPDHSRVFNQPRTGNKVSQGVRQDDVWDIPRVPPIKHLFPTQKPEALLERIIRASSNEGDLMLDPFCGCGTATVAAERLNRRWIGIVITHLAVTIMRHRLQDTFRDELKPYEIIGQPQDVESARALAQESEHDGRYQFEWWASSLVDARPAQDRKKGADSGVDGYINFFDDNSARDKRIVVQVKSGQVNRGQIAMLKGDMQREKAEIGLFITLREPTRPMVTEAAAAGFYTPEHYPDRRYPRVQILTIEELLSGKRAEYPRLAPDATFRRAPRRRRSAGAQSRFA